MTRRRLTPDLVLVLRTRVSHRPRDEPGRVLDAARGSSRGPRWHADDRCTAGPKGRRHVAGRERRRARGRALEPPRSDLPDCAVSRSARPRGAAATERLRRRRLPSARGPGTRVQLLEPPRGLAEGTPVLSLRRRARDEPRP